LARCSISKGGLTKAAALCLSRRSVAKEEVPRLGAKAGPLATSY